MSRSVAGIVLAAGAGTRFGGLKQLAQFEGRPLLQHAVDTLSASPVAVRILVLGAGADRIRKEIDPRGAEEVRCADWEEGQSRSLAAGIEAARRRGAGACLVLLGDEPRVTPAAVERVIAARGERPAVRATYGGEPGHPVLLEEELFDRAMTLAGDTGARVLFGDGGEGVTEVACDDVASGADVDTAVGLEKLGGGR